MSESASRSDARLHRVKRGIETLLPAIAKDERYARMDTVEGLLWHVAVATTESPFDELREALTLITREREREERRSVLLEEVLTSIAESHRPSTGFDRRGALGRRGRGSGSPRAYRPTEAPSFSEDERFER